MLARREALRAKRPVRRAAGERGIVYDGAVLHGEVVRRNRQVLRTRAEICDGHVELHEAVPGFRVGESIGATCPHLEVGGDELIIAGSECLSEATGWLVCPEATCGHQRYEGERRDERQPRRDSTLH